MLHQHGASISTLKAFKSAYLSICNLMNRLKFHYIVFIYCVFIFLCFCLSGDILTHILKNFTCPFSDEQKILIITIMKIIAITLKSLCINIHRQNVHIYEIRFTSDWSSTLAPENKRIFCFRGRYATLLLTNVAIIFICELFYVMAHIRTTAN